MIEHKKKICKKGSGKAMGFPGCNSESWKLEYGLCTSCLYDWMTQTELGKVEYQKRFNYLKAKNWKEEKAKMKESVKTLSDYKNDLQKEINFIVRLIDNGHPCIATGSLEGKKNAGHYISIGSNDTLRFHLENIWLQSEHSNMWKSGDTLRYQQGIIKLFGVNYLDYMNSLQSITVIKLTSEEIKSKITICRQIIKDLKMKNTVYSNQDRIRLRKIFNKRIGIYN
jgi:hypothetical protein